MGGEGKGLPSGFTVLVGVFLMGVGFVVDAAGMVVFFSALGLSFLRAVGFDALPTGVFLTGVDAVAGLLDPTVSVFCVPSGVLALTGVAFAGTGAFG